MFYVSSIQKTPNGELIGVTDTKDNVEEFITKGDILNYLNSHNIFIYGAKYSENRKGVSVEVLEFYGWLNKDLYWYLMKIIDDGFSDTGINGFTTGFANYLAGANIGSTIFCAYTLKDGKVGQCTFVKRDWDCWKFDDSKSKDHKKEFSNFSLVSKIINMASQVKINDIYPVSKEVKRKGALKF